ncbi:hypothetical protein B5F17_11525 [Butyricicoccus pullicaecorum]|uniref:Uncharacterized protein n=1 Tax=Butyricicoccus pullicaecorum TaxID=501571 RepID=A0A1Y4L7N1_9FIRM|nr:hypothetical protein [Butyricicoccus pullicaecorum]OUP51870.1 hypothetical protein B5F17_11525 [Butyricicoccus pullicaecorum]
MEQKAEELEIYLGLFYPRGKLKNEAYRVLTEDVLFSGENYEIGHEAVCVVVQTLRTEENIYFISKLFKSYKKEKIMIYRILLVGGIAFTC